MVELLEKDNGKEVAIGVEDMTFANAIFDDQNYRDAVETLMQLRSDKPIGNSQPLHAAILFEAFFKNAKKRVCIFCKNLNDNIFGNAFVREAAELALLQNKIIIDIIIQEEAPDAGLFAQFLENNKSNSLLRVRKVQKEKTRNAPVNFCVMDDHALRFEKDHNNVKAFAIMYSPALASMLLEKFEKLSKETIPVQIQLSDPAYAI